MQVVLAAARGSGVPLFCDRLHLVSHGLEQPLPPAALAGGCFDCAESDTIVQCCASRMVNASKPEQSILRLRVCVRAHIRTRDPRLATGRPPSLGSGL